MKSIFSYEEVIALIDSCGLVPSCLITKDLVDRIRLSLDIRRETELMSADEERAAHEFLATVVARNRRSGKKSVDPSDWSEQGRFEFINFD